MTAVFTHSQSIWNMGGEHLLRDETIHQGREEAVHWGKGETVCWRSGEAICQEKELFVEGGGSHSSQEGGSCLLRQGSPSAKGRRRLLSKVEGSCLLKEDGWQPFIERGRTRLFVKRGRMPAWEREERGRMLAVHWERGRMPAIHWERVVAICWEREEAAVPCGGSEEQWISTLLGNSKFNNVGISNSVDLNKLQLITWSCSHSKKSWHRCVYKRYDNVDTNLWLNLPPICCQGKTGVKFTDVWHMSDWPLTLCNFSWLNFYWDSPGMKMMNDDWCHRLLFATSLTVMWHCCVLQVGHAVLIVGGAWLLCVVVGAGHWQQWWARCIGIVDNDGGWERVGCLLMTPKLQGFHSASFWWACLPGNTILAEFEFHSKFCQNHLINLAGPSAKFDSSGIPGIAQIPPDSCRNQWRTIKTSLLLLPPSCPVKASSFSNSHLGF